MKGIEGYGRYDDSPEHVGCPRAKSDMTPCVARDGCLAVTDENDQLCVGCASRPSELLKQLVRAVTEQDLADEALLPRDHEDQPVRRPLVDDLAIVLSQTVVGWENIIGANLAEAPQVKRVMARYRAMKGESGGNAEERTGEGHHG